MDLRLASGQRVRTTLGASLAAALASPSASCSPVPCSRGLKRPLPPALDEDDANKAVASADLAAGDKVRLRNMHEANNGKKPYLEHHEGIIKRIYPPLSASDSYVFDIYVSPTEPLQRLSRHYFNPVRTWKGGGRIGISVGSIVSTPQGVGVVASQTSAAAVVQLDSTSQAVRVPLKDVVACSANVHRSPPPVMPLLSRHQCDASDFMCAEGESSRLGILPMGAGKTLMGLSVVARCIRGLQEPTTVMHEDVAIVLCPAALIDLVWMPSITRQTCFGQRAWVYTPRQDLPSHASVVLVSYDATLSEDALRLLLKGRTLQVSVADECAELRNGGERWKLASMVMRASRRCVGMAGIPLSTNIKQIVHQCMLLRYDGEYLKADFWEQDNALEVMRKRGAIFWLDDATMLRSLKCHPQLRDCLPRHYPDAEVKYEPQAGHFKTGRLFTEYVRGCYMENWEVPEIKTAYYVAKPDAMRARSLAVCDMPGSKLRVTIDVLVRLLTGMPVQGLEQQPPHVKFVVVAVFMVSLDALQYVIKQRIPELQQYRYDGSIKTSDRSANLLEFSKEQRPCVLFLGADSGGIGLNINQASCMLIYELPGSAKDFNQLRCRVVRTGNVNKVQIVSLRGPVQVARADLHEDHREVAARLGLDLA